MTLQTPSASSPPFYPSPPPTITRCAQCNLLQPRQAKNTSGSCPAGIEKQLLLIICFKFNRGRHWQKIERHQDVTICVTQSFFSVEKMSGVISKARAVVANLSFSLFTFSSLEGRGMSEFISTLLNSFKTQALLFFLGPLGERRRIGMFRKRQSYSFGQTHAIFIALCRLITRLKGVYTSTKTLTIVCLCPRICLHPSECKNQRKPRRTRAL